MVYATLGIASLVAKKVISLTQAIHKEDFYDKLNNWGGERDLYLLGKSRHQRTYDIENVCCFNNKNGTLLTSRGATTIDFRCNSTCQCH